MNVTVNASMLLPVELVSFTGTLNDRNEIEIGWVTALEMNNQGFVLEKLVSDRFVTIHQEDGAVNSGTMRAYHFTDRRPVGGTNLYRLKQIDLDGSITYSGTISVKYDPLDAGTLFPTLARDFVQVRLPADEHQVELHLYNASGQLLHTKTDDSGSAAVTLNVLDLEPGPYFVMVKAGQSVQTLRFNRL